MLSLNKKLIKIYAIKIGNYVEIRTAFKEPKRLISKLTKKVEKERVKESFNSSGDFAGYKVEKYPATFKIIQVSYIGGKVKGVCKYTYFVRTMGLSIPKDGMIEIPLGWRAKLGKGLL